MFQDEENLKIDLSTSKSKLDKAIQDLVQMIFDIESMKKAMKEFEVRYVLTFIHCIECEKYPPKQLRGHF